MPSSSAFEFLRARHDSGVPDWLEGEIEFVVLFTGRALRSARPPATQQLTAQLIALVASRSDASLAGPGPGHRSSRLGIEVIWCRSGLSESTLGPAFVDFAENPCGARPVRADELRAADDAQHHVPLPRR